MTESAADAERKAAAGGRAHFPGARFLGQSRRSQAIRLGAAFALLLALAAALAPWTVSRNALRSEIVQQLTAVSGLTVYTRGSTTFSLLPQPRIRIENVALVDPGGAVTMEAARLSGAVRLLPLLAGRLELASAAFEQPSLTINLDVRPTKPSAPARAAETRPATATARAADEARVGVIGFHDGRIVLRRGDATVETFDHVDATLDWRRISAPAALESAFDWRGERVEATFWAGHPADLLHGENSPVTLQLRAPSLMLSANGSGAVSPRAQFDGRIVASSDLPRRLASLLGVQAPLTFSAMKMDGEATATANAVNLANLKLRLGADDYQGSLALRAEGDRPQLSGTLSAPHINLTRLLRDAPPLVGADRHFSHDALDWRWLTGLDMDLRLSAAQVVLNRLSAKDVAGAVLLNAGRLEMSLADAQLYKGSIKAHAIVTPDNQGRFALKANMQARGVDWGAFGWDHSGDSYVNGRADVTVNLDGAGRNIDEMARSATGSAQIDLADGEIVGLDVERVLRRIDKRPLASLADIRSGHTPFGKAKVALEIADNRAKIADGVVMGANFVMNLAGDALLAERQLEMKAAVTPLAAGAEQHAHGRDFSFDLLGSWDNPAIVPDARAIILRSDAAQPLFGASAPRR
ncbi:MAG: AsmA family protein [Hyphomicrobiales bacterium]|nr:AsmA family protein [Hyphomicrobiales bacterium]